MNTRLLGWGVGFFDMDNDGWLDLLMSNEHVYPEVDNSKADSGTGSRVIVTATTTPGPEKPTVQIDELRSGGSYFSQTYLRMHFGLDRAKRVDVVELVVERAGGSVSESRSQPARRARRGRKDFEVGAANTSQAKVVKEYG